MSFRVCLLGLIIAQELQCRQASQWTQPERRAINAATHSQKRQGPCPRLVPRKQVSMGMQVRAAGLPVCCAHPHMPAAIGLSALPGTDAPPPYQTRGRKFGRAMLKACLFGPARAQVL